MSIKDLDRVKADIERAQKSLMGLYGQHVAATMMAMALNQVAYTRAHLEALAPYDGMSDEEILEKKQQEKAQEVERLQEEMIERLKIIGGNPTQSSQEPEPTDQQEQDIDTGDIPPEPPRPEPKY